MFPDIDDKVIDTVNKLLDSGKGWGAMFSGAGKVLVKSYPVVGMGVKRIGHRSTNHDLLSAIVTGYAEAGYEGVQAASMMPALPNRS